MISTRAYIADLESEGIRSIIKAAVLGQAVKMKPIATAPPEVNYQWGPVSVAHCARSKWFCKWMMLILFNAAASLTCSNINAQYIHPLLNILKNSWSSGETFIIMVKDKSVNAGTGLECVISVGLFSPGH